MLRYILLFNVFLTVIIPSAIGQYEVADNFQFEINKVYPAISVNRSDFNNAKKIKDLNRYFKPSWVKKYKSVKITTNNKGKVWSSIGDNDILTEEQKEIMLLADVSKPIEVNVLYIPDNTLPFEEVKEFCFSFIVEPDRDAIYSGGPQKLQQYLKVNAIDKIPEGTYTGFDLSAVKFTINEEGKVVDAYLVEYPRNETVDDILLETVCNMPTWQPAQYADGTKVKQEFAFTVGNMQNCMVNLLNIRKLPIEVE